MLPRRLVLLLALWQQSDCFDFTQWTICEKLVSKSYRFSKMVTIQKYFLKSLPSLILLEFQFYVLVKFISHILMWSIQEWWRILKCPVINHQPLAIKLTNSHTRVCVQGDSIQLVKGAVILQYALQTIFQQSPRPQCIKVHFISSNQTFLLTINQTNPKIFKIALNMSRSCI